MIKQNTKQSQKHPLSSSWQTSQRMTSNRLSFFGKGITCIDRLDSVPERVLHSIKELDLSHNVIMRIENVRQFPNLQVLNLAHNHVTDGRYLAKLDKLTKLKVVMVKGNPFLRSGQGKILAYKFLLAYETDIQILSTPLQQKLSSLITKFCQTCLKKQHYKNLQLQIELITEYNISLPEQGTGQVYDRIVGEVLEECLGNVVDTCRKEVVKRVMAVGDKEGREGKEGKEGKEGGFGLETREELEEWFGGCLAEEERRVERDLEEISRMVADKEEVLMHVKKMRKQKRSKSNQSFTFKRITKPLLQKPPNTENLPQKPSPSPPKPTTSLHSPQLPLDLLPPIPKKHLQQKFESYYNIMLTKHNPVYQLLYSPLHSLKSREKDLLIETLSAHLKEKSYAVYKGERVKEEFVELGKRYVEKERLLKTQEEKFMGFKIGMNQRVALLEDYNETKDRTIQELNQTISQLLTQKSQMKKRLQYLQQQLSESKLKTIKQSNLLQKTVTQQYLTQQIQSLQAQTLKKHYLSLLIKKSQKFHKFKQTQTLNKITQNRELMELCFAGWRSQAENRRLVGVLRKMGEGKRVGECLRNGVGNGRFLGQVRKVRGSVRVAWGKDFMGLLKSGFIERKTEKENIQKFVQRQNSLKTQMYFKSWRAQTEDRKVQVKTIRANSFYESKLIKKMFKDWLVYLRLPIYQQAQLSVDLRLSQSNRFMKLLKNNYETNRVIDQKFMHLIVFLNKNSRIQNFFKFKKYTVLNSQLRQIKQKRLNLILKSTYIYQFLHITSTLQKLHSLHKKNHTKILQLRKKQIFTKLNSEAYTKQMRASKFKRIIEIYRKVCIAASLRDSLKEFMIQDKRSKNYIRGFFGNLQLGYWRKLRDQRKAVQLTCMLKLSQSRLSEEFRMKKEFLSRLQQPKQQKNKLKQLLNKKSQKILTKHFNKWHTQLLKSQIEYLKTRIHEFGPQIQQISNRQKSTFEQKLVLMNIIDNKQKTIKGFMKQLEEAEYTIQTKEEKYQKLKEFLHGTGGIGDEFGNVGGGVVGGVGKNLGNFLGEDTRNSRVPERDYDTFLDQDRKDYFNSFRRF